MREGLMKVASGLRNAVGKGQLPPDLDTVRAAAMLHAFIGGSLRDMLLLPDVIDLGEHAERLVQAMIDGLRLSPALRTSGSGGVRPADGTGAGSTG
jgi:TetR/AcrR family acrAB operon transcriptional repressor